MGAVRGEPHDLSRPRRSDADQDGWPQTWAEHRIEVEQVLERGDDVVAAMHVIARGKGSGVNVDVRLYPHVKLREGKVVYVFEHDDRAAALNAAGIER
jgi:hypothetical protein